MTALFSDDTSFADGFCDKVAVIHDYFDKDEDEHLNFTEIATLQYVTSGTVMTEDQYVMVCRTLQCHPSKGLNLDMLRITYASDGADVDADYDKVFHTSDNQNRMSEETTNEKDLVYEAGKEGFDIS